MVALSALALAFLLLGWPFATRMGIEVDEAMVTAGIYEGAAPWYAWHLGGGEIPVMLLTYLGALKTWMYNLIFAIWPPGPIPLRLPTLIMGAVTVVLTFRFVDRILSRSAAWIVAVLLAFDPSYILTEAIDFGPVAVEQMLKMAALLLLVTFHERPSSWKVGGAFFLLGLALWDKAVFVWLLVGLACATPVIWRQVRVHVNARNTAIAGVAFLAGAAPLVVYNMVRPLETFTSNVRIAPDNPFIKLVLLVRTLNGSGLFGYFTAPDFGPHPGVAHSAVQHLAFGIASLTDEPWTSVMSWATAAAILAIPLVRRTPAFRPALFFLIAMLVTWLQMFLTNAAGGAVHHVVLLWPFHLIVIAAVLTALVRSRAVRIAVTAGLCVSSLLVVNSYYVNLIRNGTGVRWTDAFPSLHASLTAARAPVIVTCDWGILETLILLSRGELPVADASAALTVGNQPQYREQLDHMIATPGALFVAHGAAYEQWAGTRNKLTALAATLGYTPEPVQTIQDRNGRPIFEIFRFRHAS